MYDLQFEPKKEEELNTLLAIGIGDYEVIKSTAKISHIGNAMIELVLKVWDSQGNQGNIFDYLILNGHNLSLRKIRHFCYSAGLESTYEEGKLNASQCLGKVGKLQIGIQKDKEEKYPDKNSVQDYIYIAKNDKNDAPLNDDVPF